MCNKTHFLNYEIMNYEIIFMKVYNNLYNYIILYLVNYDRYIYIYIYIYIINITLIKLYVLNFVGCFYRQICTCK